MKRVLCALLVCATMFVACGDSDSEFISRPDGKISSSSVSPESNSREFGPCKTETEDNCEYGTVTDRGGKIYKTVKIGNLWWMAENLSNDVGLCFNDSAEYCAKYGALYTWASAKFDCPTDWRLPTKSEFENLIEMVGGDSVAITVLRSSTGWKDGENGTDAYGFSALPAGMRNVKRYHNVDTEYFSDNLTCFWSSTEFDDYYQNQAYFFYLDKGHAFVSEEYKPFYLSVRCVNDKI